MRRKPRVVWLPPTNANSFGSDNTSGIQIFAVDTSDAQPVATGEIPLVIDAQSDPLDALAVNSLSDIENSGYRLRRIVGKIWVLNNGSDETQAAFTIVTAGIIVRRALDSTGVSYAVQTGDETLINPAHIGNYGDPWIWRRSWFISNRDVAADPANAGLNLTPNNWGHGPSAVDGPHVDQKTARLISSEERLFLNVSVRQNIESAGQIDMTTTILTDLRCLASLRTSTGNRRNASR